MIPIRAGDLTQSVQLWDPGEAVVDAYGQAIAAGTTQIGTFRAKVENLRGRLVTSGVQAFSNITHRVTMRWLGTAIPSTADNPNRLILPRMFLILQDGSRLDIIDADNPLKARTHWVLNCSEKVVS